MAADATEPALDLRAHRSGISLRVRVKPRSSRSRITGIREGALVVQIQAPPAEGAANAALLDLLAGVLDRPPSSLSLMYGAGHRDKVVLIAGAELESVRSRLLSAARGADK